MVKVLPQSSLGNNSPEAATRINQLMTENEKATLQHNHDVIRELKKTGCEWEGDYEVFALRIYTIYERLSSVVPVSIPWLPGEPFNPNSVFYIGEMFMRMRSAAYASYDDPRMRWTDHGWRAATECFLTMIREFHVQRIARLLDMTKSMYTSGYNMLWYMCGQPDRVSPNSPYNQAIRSLVEQGLIPPGCEE